MWFTFSQSGSFSVQSWYNFSAKRETGAIADERKVVKLFNTFFMRPSGSIVILGSDQFIAAGNVREGMSVTL